MVRWEPILGHSSGRPVGFRVDPPFGVKWEPLRTLRHFAALVEHRTGHEVRVGPTGRPEELEPGDEAFEVRTAHNVGGPAPYEVVYAWLSGFENGVHECLWRLNDKAKK